MSEAVAEDIKRWTAKRKRALVSEIIQGKATVAVPSRACNRAPSEIEGWVQKHEAGAFDDDARVADPIQEHEAWIAALERLVGKQALELEFARRALRHGRPQRSTPLSVIAGPAASPSRGDAS